MTYLGDFAEDATVRRFFNTVDSAGSPITIGGTATAEVYKDGGTTQITAGVTITEDFDGVTGLHLLAVDMSADAGYTTGSDYAAVISVGTADSVSIVGGCLAQWSCENRRVNALKDGTITANTFDTGVLATDADIADAVWAEDIGSPTLNSVKQYLVTNIPDAIAVVDGNVDSILSDTNAILLDTGTQGVLLAANAIGDAVIQDNAITAAKIATGAITNAKFAAGAINAAAVDTAALTSAKFATGAITSTVIADAAITAAKIATDAIDADALATDAIAEIADQVWREDITTHTAIADSTAEALNAASSAGDPWNTTLPGSYTAGKAGNILANVNTQVGTAGAGLTAIPWNNAWDAEVQSECADAIVASLTATEVSAIKAVTDLLTASQAEPSGVPAANETPLEKLAYIFMALRNKLTVTASAMTFHDDSESPEWRKVLTDDGTTYTEGEATTP